LRDALEMGRRSGLKLFGAGDEVFEGNAPTVAKAVYELTRATITHYPNSDFAKRYQAV
jgi:hypothetical protein